MYRRDHERHFSLVEVLAADTSQVNDLTTQGTLIAGYVRLQGLLLPAQITKKADSAWMVRMDLDYSDDESEFETDKESIPIVKARIEFDDPQMHGTVERAVFWMVPFVIKVLESRLDKELSLLLTGLVLAPTNKQKGQFSRIGRFQIKDILPRESDSESGEQDSSSVSTQSKDDNKDKELHETIQDNHSGHELQFRKFGSYDRGVDVQMDHRDPFEIQSENPGMQNSNTVTKSPVELLESPGAESSDREYPIPTYTGRPRFTPNMIEAIAAEYGWDMDRNAASFQLDEDDDPDDILRALLDDDPFGNGPITKNLPWSLDEEFEASSYENVRGFLELCDTYKELMQSFLKKAPVQRFIEMDEDGYVTIEII
jgi:hypothetical protein